MTKDFGKGEDKIKKQDILLSNRHGSGANKDRLMLAERVACAI